jgi:hypothetical protein
MVERTESDTTIPPLAFRVFHSWIAGTYLPVNRASSVMTPLLCIVNGRGTLLSLPCLSLRAHCSGTTVEGLRSPASDWLAESTKVNRSPPKVRRRYRSVACRTTAGGA